jgi:two-component system chemotaxis response regulator CheV
MSIIDRVDRLTRLAGRNRLELLLFRLTSNQIFGINVFKVREVLKCPPLRPIPHSHYQMRGVFHARGQTITVIDLAAVLGQGASKGTPDEFVIVTEYSGHVQGYLVQQVLRIVNLRWDDIKPPPAGIGNANYLTAVTTLENQLVEILDVERVLSEIVGLSVEVSEEVLAQNVPNDDIPRRIFIADDSAVARRQMMRVMDQLGVEYEIAENGLAAFEKLKAYAAEGPITKRFAMLLSDIEMPQMDGYTLTKTIKADPDLKDLYVCLHTSLSGSFNDSMANSVGANKLVAKFEPDDLAAVVMSVVNVGSALTSKDIRG